MRSLKQRQTWKLMATLEAQRAIGRLAERLLAGRN
jgi:hypothetical protein